MKIRVMLMRRDDLDERELGALKSTCPENTEFEFFRTDPFDYKEHLRLCELHKPDLVFLPREKPVPALAMEQGFRHVTLTPDGLKQLVKVVPEFTAFKWLSQ